MQKNILIYVSAEKNWMGGIYYIKNLLFLLSISNEAQDKYNYYIFVKKDMIKEFHEFINEMQIAVIEIDENGKEDEQLLSVCADYDISVVLPVRGGGYTWLIKDISLYWIPDFQEIYLPENFTKDVIRRRKSLRDYISNEHGKIMISSNDAYATYKDLCPQNAGNAFVVHFTSYIKPLIEQMTDKFEKQILDKYGIRYEYVFVANQFWKHKNYIVVLKAMNLIINERKTEMHLVCTGSMNSYGEKDAYVENLNQYIKENNLSSYVHFLGMVERIEQLCIMKNANLLVQPSLFEGWGCSVEDGKVMGKEMLLSDINVHKEQQYPKAKLFPRDDNRILAETILNNFFRAERYDLKYGNEYMIKKAQQYSKELQKAIDAIEGGGKRDYTEELESLRKEKLLRLFGGMEQHKICIYGVGNHTKKMIEGCWRFFGNTEFVYSDSDENKWGKQFAGGKIYSPDQLLALGIKRVVISSIRYQEEIYHFLMKYEKDLEIVKIYDSERELCEILW